jgi:hypothetical protein
MHQNRRQHQRRSKISEGLRPNDLNHLISHRFTIDQYKSKMGSDEDIIVLAFRIKDRYPTVDAMEFIEKGYDFVLDADMSAGEERDGQYSLFIELERNKKAPDQIKDIVSGLNKLCDHGNKWRFKYYKDVKSHEFSKEAIEQFVPLDKDQYKEKMKQNKITDVSEILNQGTAEVADISENDQMIMQKPFAGNLNLKLINYGLYDHMSKLLSGPIQLDESSNSQILFLEKYLGNYEIHKINNKFLIRNGEQAVVVAKGDW